MESKTDFRSCCSVSSSLDIIGDKWTLVIVRDMLLAGKKTFKEFSESKEGIATNILSDRLAKLECNGIITKEKLPENKKTNIYRPTKIGIDLLPIVLELSLWTTAHRKHFGVDLPKEYINLAKEINKGKEAYIANMKNQLLADLKKVLVLD